MSSICTLWWSSLTSYDDRLAALLDETELRRAAAYRTRADRARFTLAVAMAKLAVARRRGIAPVEVTVDRRCPDCAEPHGRPTVAGGGPDLSVSHGGDLVVVAVCGGGVIGVDVDRIEPGLAGRVAARVLSPAERRRFAGLPAAARPGWFGRVWSLKEAVLKATGDGLRVPPAAVDIDFDGTVARLVDYPGRPELPAALRVLPVDARRPGHTAAVALPAGVRGLVERDAGAALRACIERH